MEREDKPNENRINTDANEVNSLPSDQSALNQSKLTSNNHKVLDIKKHISTILIVIGIIIILIPIIGKVIAQKNQEALLESFYLELENSNLEENTNAALDEVFEWGVDLSNQQEIAQNVENIQNGEINTKILKKMPKPIGIITISSINAKLPIAEGVDMDTLKFAIGHMPGTAGLGSIGNSVLAGHRSYTFGAFFNRLDEVEVGDEIVIEKTDGSKTNYEVYKTYLVDPTDTSVLNSTDEHKVLTLITCHPEINPDSRLIVHAIEKE